MNNVNLKLIKEKRISKGFSLEYMSEILALKSRSSYFKRETGEYAFKAEEIPVIANELDLSYDNIFAKKLTQEKQLIN